jgi:hypothetical protein
LETQVLTLPMSHDRRGNLTVIESGVDIPFEVRRVYYLHDVPGGASRGGHAHRELHQLIIAVSGSFTITVEDETSIRSYHLNRAFQGLYLPPMRWRELDNFSSGSVCLVLASAHYEESDYLRSHSEFRAALDLRSAQ